MKSNSLRINYRGIVQVGCNSLNVNYHQSTKNLINLLVNYILRLLPVSFWGVNTITNYVWIIWTSGDMNFVNC